MLSRRVCVAGASGRVGSSLVKKLLDRGHIVHATIRNIHDPEKAGLLQRLPGADSRLHLFEADLFHPHQVDQAIHDCEFVFLVAFPTKPFANDAEVQNDESSQQEPFKFFYMNLLGLMPLIALSLRRDAAADAVLATLHSVLSTCERSGTVKRLIYTGSVLTASPLDEHGLLSTDFIDESCWTKPDVLGAYSTDFKFYVSSKTESAKLLASYGAKEGEEEYSSLEVVDLGCGVVGGEALVDSVFGVAMALSPLTGNTVWLDDFRRLQNLLRSVPLVHLDDACDAHLFCMDVPLTPGRRFLCASDYPSLSEIMAYYRLKPEECGCSVKGGSSKLADMGFEYKYSMEQKLDQSILCAKKLAVIKDIARMADQIGSEEEGC